MPVGRSPLALVFSTVVVDLIGFGIVIPLLPLYAQRYGASGLAVGLMMTAYAFTQLVCAPLWGRLSDRVGRRPVLLVGLAGSTASYLLAGLAGSLAVLFVARVLAGAAGGTATAAQAYIADVTVPEERARGMGLIGTAIGIGFVLGPALGGWLAGYGPQAPFFGAAALCGANLLAAATLLREPHRRTVDSPSVAVSGGRVTLGSGLLPGKSGTWRLVFFLALFFVATFAIANLEATFAIFTAQAFGYREQQNGYLFAYIGLVMAVVQGVLVGPLARRLGERALVSVGFLVVAASMFLIPRCTGLSHLVFALALWASGGALASPSLFSLISRQARASTQGRVLGLAQSATGMARVVGPAWGGFAFDHFGRQAPCLTGGALMAVASLASLALFHPGLQPPTPVQPTPPPASPPASPPVLPAALPPASPPVSAPAASPFFSTSPPSPLL